MSNDCVPRRDILKVQAIYYRELSGTPWNIYRYLHNDSLEFKIVLPYLDNPFSSGLSVFSESTSIRYVFWMHPPIVLLNVLAKADKNGGLEHVDNFGISQPMKR